MASIRGAHMRKWLLSLPPVEYCLQQLREALIGALKCGPIPKHIAFVMDGNRRYARTHKLETVEGHHLGFEALARILEVCYKSGVRVVTIYAFSIENFKRSKYEVDGLMDLAKTKLLQMSEHGALLDRYGASVRVLGDRSLVRDDVLEQIDKAVNMTKHNSHAVLNVCFPYTSREEITHSIRQTVIDFSTPPAERRDASTRGFSESHIERHIQSRKLSDVVEEEQLFRSHEVDTRPDSSVLHSDADSTEFSDHDSTHLPPPSSQTSHSTSPLLRPVAPPSKVKSSRLPDPETITTATLNQNSYTADCPPLDLLIRTSGVRRLSDFMLWQCHEETEVRFLDVLWPEFDLWHFLPVLLEWQWRQRRISNDEAALNGATVKTP